LTPLPAAYKDAEDFGEPLALPEAAAVAAAFDSGGYGPTRELPSATKPTAAPEAAASGEAGDDLEGFTGPLVPPAAADGDDGSFGGLEEDLSSAHQPPAAEEAVGNGDAGDAFGNFEELPGTHLPLESETAASREYENGFGDFRELPLAAQPEAAAGCGGQGSGNHSGYFSDVEEPAEVPAALMAAGCNEGSSDAGFGAFETSADLSAASAAVQGGEVGNGIGVLDEPGMAPVALAAEGEPGDDDGLGAFGASTDVPAAVWTDDAEPGGDDGGFGGFGDSVSLEPEAQEAGSDDGFGDVEASGVASAAEGGEAGGNDFGDFGELRMAPATEGKPAGSDDGFGDFEASTEASAAEAADTEDGHGDADDDGFGDFEASAEASAAEAADAAGGQGDGGDEGFGDFEEPTETQSLFQEVGAAATKEGTDNNNDGFGDFEDSTVAHVSSAAAGGAVRGEGIDGDDGVGGFEELSGAAHEGDSDDGFGSFEEPPAALPPALVAKGSAATSATILEQSGSALVSTVNGILLPLTGLEGVRAAWQSPPPGEAGSESIVSTYPTDARSPVLRAALPASTTQPLDASRAMLKFWSGTPAEEEFLAALGLEWQCGLQAAEAGGSGTIHRSGSRSTSSIADSGSGSGVPASATAAASPYLGPPEYQTESGWGSRSLSVSDIPASRAEERAAGTPVARARSIDPFAASGPVMSLSEYLSPSKNRRGRGPEEGVLPTPGGPAEDGSEYDPFGVFMAMQAAKNTPMPGTPTRMSTATSAAALPASTPIGTAGASGLGSSETGMPSPIRAVSSAEQLGIEEEAEEGLDTLPVSIAVPLPRSTESDGEDWDNLFQRAEQPAASTHGQGAPASAASAEVPELESLPPAGLVTRSSKPPVGGYWQATKDGLRAAAAGRQIGRRSPQFESVQEAVAALPELSFME